MALVASQRVISINRIPATLWRSSPTHIGSLVLPGQHRLPGFHTSHPRWTSSTASRPPPIPRVKRLLVRARDVYKNRLRWSLPADIKLGVAELVMSKAELQSAANVFVSIIDESFPESPRWQDVPKLFEHIDRHAEASALKKLIAHRAIYFLAVILTQHHPRHALYAVCLAHLQAPSRAESGTRWAKVAGMLNARSHWTWVLELVELRLRYDARASTGLLNKLLESYIKGGMDEDPEDALKLFQHAGAEPDDVTRLLLRTIASRTHIRTDPKVTHTLLVAVADAETWLTIIGGSPPLPVLKSHAVALSAKIAKLPEQKALLNHISDMTQVNDLLHGFVKDGKLLQAIHLANLAHLMGPEKVRRHVFPALVKTLGTVQRPPNSETLLVTILELEKDILGKPSPDLAICVLRECLSPAEDASGEDILNSTRRVLLASSTTSLKAVKLLKKLKGISLSRLEASGSSKGLELQKHWTQLIDMVPSLKDQAPERSDASSAAEKQDELSSTDAAASPWSTLSSMAAPKSALRPSKDLLGDADLSPDEWWSSMADNLDDFAGAVALAEPNTRASSRSDQEVREVAPRSPSTATWNTRDTETP